MKKLPLGIQNFPEIRTENYVYIDKTPLALKLADSGKYYFLSRPRRFGKSLFLDTLKCLFEGRKELFKGLFVYDKWDWDKTYPVIRIDFSKGLVKTKKELSDKIGAFIRQAARDFNLEIQETGPSNAFEELIRKCHDRHDMPVVILIDEYDKPILDNITDNDTALIMRDGLRDLYSVIKGMDPFIRFAFLTGVSKFSKMNLFSGLNNLTDITLDDRYATVCGYTQMDVETGFKEYLARTGPSGPVDLAELAKWYNGYSFSGEPVYNPYDILLFFDKGRQYKNYWFESGTPTFLMDMIRDKQYFLPDLENLEVSEQLLNTFDVGNIPIESLMFQTGYLTIKKTATIFNQVIHTLSYPNFEVKNAFNQYLIGYFAEHRFQPDARLYKTLLEDDFTGLKAQIARLFAAIPYTAHGNLTHYEGFYVSVIYAFLASLGLDLTAEDITSKGRADLTLKFPGHEKIYIFEFKVIEEDRASSKQPLAQIREKRYFEKYMKHGRNIFLIGIEFSKQKRNIVSFEWEQVAAGSLHGELS
jgi:hypothetical protein